MEITIMRLALKFLTMTVSLIAYSSSISAQTILNHEIFGKGTERVIVLHDWLGDRTNYDDVRPYLSTDKFTYVFVDLRGYGKSKDIKGKYNSTEAAKDVLAVADKLGWKTFHIVGHSMTGMVVQRVSALANPRVKSIVATTPVGAKGLGVDKDTFAFFASVVTDRKAAAGAIHLLTGKQLSDSWANFKVERSMTTSTAKARRTYLDMFDKEDFSGDVKGLKTPILVIMGENDLEAFQPKNIQATFGEWYPNLKTVIAKNAGHYPMQEAPPFYASTLETFLLANSTP